VPTCPETLRATCCCTTTRPRYYFYAQDGPSAALFLVEMVVATQSRQASVTIKSDAPPPLVGAFVDDVWRACLAGFYR
jgi:hypothetical protein